MATILGQYTFTVTSAAPTTTIVLSSSLVDSDGTYGPGEGVHTQEFRRLPANVVKEIETAVHTAVVDATMTAINMDLDLDDFFPWDNQIDRVFINAEVGYANSENWTLTRTITGANVREWRLTRP
jgi:hypothetical protein